jgi:hypothetical protein
MLNVMVVYDASNSTDGAALGAGQDVSMRAPSPYMVLFTQTDVPCYYLKLSTLEQG